MGREIRMVPPNWKHPRKDDGNYKSMFDEDFETASKEWKKDYALWEKKEHPSQTTDTWDGEEFWEYEGIPDRESYRPTFTEEPTWVQVYQTVSEGYPVTPPFATKEELVDYLVENGDEWDQSRGDGGWDRKNAEAFVGRGFAMSGMAIVKDGEVEIKTPRDGS